MAGPHPKLFPRIFVKGFVRSTRECDLAQLFSHFGIVRHVVIVGGRNSYGIVTLACDDDVERVLRAGQLTSKGRRLTVVVDRGGDEEGRWTEQRRCEQQQQVVSSGPGKMIPPTSATVKQRTVSTHYKQSLKTGSVEKTDYRTTHSQAVLRQSTNQSPRPHHTHLDTKLPVAPRPQPPPPPPPPPPLHYRHFSSPVPHLPAYSKSFISAPPRASPVLSPLPSPPDLVSFSCSPYQPLPLVFPIYHMDTFYMSMTPLPPGYCIRPISSSQD